ncbi:hypothetical protein QVD17_16439 [Tagetes erecta]|uniref:FAR1 domain-containing protein n=1 Tax=Tagetes erecta TaxID=13708 RepID=A0AAD8KQW8_TARER|nr:hypothetical protein QVD17_16439 [Tagetes erecta]
MWVPSVTNSDKPEVGAVFQKWEDVLNMYEAYAAKAGFDSRLSTIARTNGVITHRYIVCNKQGKSRRKNVNTMDTASRSSNKRNSNKKVTGFLACIRVRAVPGPTSFILYELIEEHNHGLVSIENMDLSRRSRQLRFTNQKHIHQLNTTGFRHTIAHHVQTTLKGGHHNVRGFKTDYKNFSRDIKCFIWDKDAEMLKVIMEGQVSTLTIFQTNVGAGYFRVIPLCCLMKTTSRCESSNSFFKVYSSPGNTLLQFMIAYESALNAQ